MSFRNYTSSSQLPAIYDSVKFYYTDLRPSILNLQAYKVPLERLHVFVVRFLVVALPAREEEPGTPGAFVNGHAAFASHDLDRQHLRRRLRLVEKSDDGLVVDAAVAAEVDEEDAALVLVAGIEI